MGHDALAPNPWMILPFGVLLLAIAVGPLLFAHWWHKHYPKAAFALAAITLTYYLLGLHAHGRVLHVAQEYVSFICLIGSLFIVAGGIHINVKGEATPLANTVFLFIGAVIANILGTTGASMLMIRPWIRMNKYRITGFHVVFFIFIVSNVGGCLTPIGDPPLFLGYLKGIPFFWVLEHCWPMWLTATGSLLLTFFALDFRNYQRAPKRVRAALAEPEDLWRFRGGHNVFFLALILGSVFINRPLFLRETLMIIAAIGSYLTTSKSIHKSNDFNFDPIKEVAILFIGIFATMMPALDWLQANSGNMGHPSPAFFYWACGSLSAVLDNAPTYLSFLSAVFGSCINPEIITQVQHLIQTQGSDIASVVGAQAEIIRNTYLGVQRYFPTSLLNGTVSVEQIEISMLLGNLAFNDFIVAISVGAVFFGAATYIGNGPNFMVKAIAEHQKVHMPSFFGYILKFTLPFLLPTLVLIWLLFF